MPRKSQTSNNRERLAQCLFSVYLIVPAFSVRALVIFIVNFRD